MSEPSSLGLSDHLSFVRILSFIKEVTPEARC